ncbi:MAG: ABC transporter ATP-binding protein [Lachnospiraceae bacterium]
MSLLEIRNLQVKFHTKTGMVEAVNHLSLDVEAGEIVGLVGESGSGKSVSMMAVMGLLNQTKSVVQGEIYFDGVELMGNEGLYSGHIPDIGMIFQNALTCLNPTMTVGRQIMETIMIHDNCKKKKAMEHAVDLLEQVGIRKPEQCMKQYPFELSGGMLQRVVIVIALACKPKLMIADEPTTSLDVTVQAQILELMKRISKEMGVAILLISHDMGVVASLCQRIYILRKGHVIETGSTDDIFYHSREAYTKELLRDSQMARYEKAHEVIPQTEAILRVCEVEKYYKDKAVDGVSFTIHQGETLGLVGESSCGKSTLARMIIGIQKPTKGEIYFKNHRMDQRNNKEWMPYRQKVQMIFQNPYASLNPRMTIGEIIEEPLRANHMGTGEERRAKVEKILELVGMHKEDTYKYPHEFSGGQRQRIGIARAFIVEPELVICDEPLSALDASIRGQVMELLEEFQKRKGLSYLFIAHDLEMVRRISHRIGVMYRGTIVELGNTKDIYEEPWHPYTKSLLAASPIANPRLARKKKQGISGITNQIIEKKREDSHHCPFLQVCKYALEECQKEAPELYTYGTRSVACFLYSNKLAEKRDKNYQMTAQI